MCFKRINRLAWKRLVPRPKSGSHHYKSASCSPWRYRNVSGSCSVRSQPLWLHWRTCCTPYKRIPSLGPRTPYLWKEKKTKKKKKSSRSSKTGWLWRLKTRDVIMKTNPVLPTGLRGLNGGRGGLSLGDAASTFSSTHWPSLLDSSAAFFAVRNKTKDETLRFSI